MNRFREFLANSPFNRPYMLAVPIGLIIVLLVVVGVSGMGGGDEDGDANQAAVIASNTPRSSSSLASPTARPSRTAAPTTAGASATPTPAETDAEPSPTSEAAVQPANTGAEATSTPVPAVAPTDTPVPFVPSATPVPAAATPVPPTNTAVPATNTPVPTNTPLPTNTPVPTKTPNPNPPTLDVQPSSVGPGTTVTSTVRNFPPNVPLTMEVQYLGSDSVGETDDNGFATGSFTLDTCEQNPDWNNLPSFITSVKVTVSGGGASASRTVGVYENCP